MEVRINARTSSDLSAMLRASPLFRGLVAADIDELARHMVRRVYRRGQIIFHRGDAAGALHYVQSGSVKVTLTTDEGKETVLALFGPGACFGEIAALDGGARSASVTAAEPTTTLALLREDLLTFIRERPDFALQLIALLAARLRRADAQLEDAYFLDLDGRLARCLLDLGTDRGEATAAGMRVPLPLSQTDLAAMLGSTRVSVNKLLGAYQDAGLISFDDGGIIIKNVDGVRRRIDG
ncbi:MAG: Crp/Fnr family transcriptional regulator [Chloroflexota bacterium]|nr:Crp/Fnr family transcriptional regulator [Chloroflexota bacterium]